MDIQEIFSYQNAISSLTSQGKFHISLGLEKISRLMGLLGNPQDHLKVIHVAGTNGKGSTCALLASIFVEAGYKTGLYTSPHLVEYTERIKIDNNDIPKDEFAELILSIIELADKNNMHVTEFEILTAAAFKYFNDEKVDMVILETGLGGRLDATNIVNPLLSIITTIDLDHIDRLGDTIDKIAFEKAGIIKDNIPIITLKDNKGLDVIKEVALQRSSLLFLADSSEYKLDKEAIIVENIEYKLPLLGLWQLKNLSLVLKSIEILNKINMCINQSSVMNGLKKVKWPGRFQYLKEKNLLLDGAHNPSGAKSLRESLDFYFPDKKRIWIYSSINTKDYKNVIKNLFNQDDIVVCTKSYNPNAVDPQILKEQILSLCLAQKIYTAENIEEALKISSEFTHDDYLVIVAGSLYTVGSLL